MEAGYDVRCASSPQGNQFVLKPEATGTWKRPQGYNSLQQEQSREQGSGEDVPNLPPTAVTWANEVVLLLRGEFPLANTHQSFT